jgi:hypothetical protein
MAKRHIELVDAAVNMTRQIFKLRMHLGIEKDAILALRPHRKMNSSLRHAIREVRTSMQVMQESWPTFTDGECADVALTIAQASSETLTNVLRGLDFSDKNRSGMVSRRTVVRRVLAWITHANGVSLDIEEIAERVNEDQISLKDAKELTRVLVADLPGIIVWSKGDPPPVDPLERTLACGSWNWLRSPSAVKREEAQKPLGGRRPGPALRRVHEDDVHDVPHDREKRQKGVESRRELHVRQADGEGHDQDRDHRKHERPAVSQKADQHTPKGSSRRGFAATIHAKKS